MVARNCPSCGRLAYITGGVCEFCGGRKVTGITTLSSRKRDNPTKPGFGSEGAYGPSGEKEKIGWFSYCSGAPGYVLYVEWPPGGPGQGQEYYYVFNDGEEWKASPLKTFEFHGPAIRYIARQLENY